MVFERFLDFRMRANVRTLRKNSNTLIESSYDIYKSNEIRFTKDVSTQSVRAFPRNVENFQT